MKKAMTIKKFTVLLAMILTLVCSSLLYGAFALEKPTAFPNDYIDDSAITIPNGQFADFSNPVLGSPSSWTGSYLTGATQTNVVSGVLDINSYKVNRDTYKLDKEDDAYISSPFGTSDFPGTNKHVLFINTNKSLTAYGYNSEAVSLLPNSFYQISCWVKTSNFSTSGAFIKLNGLSKPFSFDNINTTSISTNEGWLKYTFYIATDSMKTSNVSLALQVGDVASSDSVNNPSSANGFAMFDNVTTAQLSASEFDKIAKASTLPNNKLIADLRNNDVVTIDNSDFSSNLNNWVRNDKNPKNTQIIVANGYSNFAQYGFDGSPYAPNGSSEFNNNVLAISNYSLADEKFADPVFASIKTEKPITIKRYHYYRLSAWVKTDSIKSGTSPVMTLSGDCGVKNEDGEFTFSTPIAELAGDNSNKFRYGWKEYAFYIKGSMIKDYDVNLSLALGTNLMPASGIVFFDDIKLETISSTDYNDNSSKGTIVTLDGSYQSTGVNNGLFYEGEIKDDKLLPKDWTSFAGHEVKSLNYSTSPVDVSKIDTGLVNADVIGLGANQAHVLKIASSIPTAYAYRSSDITLTAKKFHEIKVTLSTDNISGYGANIVLKQGDKVISTIEKLTPSVPTDYTFYVQGGKADTVVNVEVWLGLNDRANNLSKLTSGSVFVSSVALTSADTGDTFNAKADNIADMLNNNDHALTYNVYSFDYNTASKLDFLAHDIYSSNDVKPTYNWQHSKMTNDAVYGISYITENYETYPVFMVKNIQAGATTVKMNNAFNLNASGYYKLTISARMNFLSDAESAVGATISVNPKYSFENIKSTGKVNDDASGTLDNSVFKDFVFFVKNGTSEGTLDIQISLGDDTYPNNKAVGSIAIKSIVLEEIQNTDYDEAKENVNNSALMVDLTTPADEKPEDDKEEDKPAQPNLPTQNTTWWIVPSILFAVALIIAIVGVIVRKAIENAKKKKKVKFDKYSSYDKRVTGTDDIPSKDEYLNNNNKDSFDDFNDTDNTAKTDEDAPVELESEEVKAEDATAENTEEVKAEETTAENAEEVKAEDATAENAEEEPKQE